MNLSEIKQRHEAAPKGPWRVTGDHGEGHLFVTTCTQAATTNTSPIVCEAFIDPAGRDNSEFLAASWQDIADLLAWVERAKEALTEASDHAVGLVAVKARIVLDELDH